MATILDTLVAEIVFKGDTKALDNVNQRLKAAFGSRFTRKLLAMPESEAQAKILTGEVLGWVARQFGLGTKEESGA